MTAPKPPVSLPVPTCIDRALCFMPDGEAVVLVTGTSFVFTDDGGLLVLPPRQRVEFDSVGGQVPYTAGAGRLYRPDGTASLIADPAGGEA